MGYLLLLLATLAWSFVGILVKTASGMADSMVITFARFFFGILFLGGFLLLKDGKIKLKSVLPWIWIGAIGKCGNYLFENMALAIGYSYGNILVPPVQTITLLIVSSIWLKEKVGGRGWTAAALCMSGVLLIGWNGETAGLIGGTNGLTTLLFAAAGFGAAFHVLSQKMLVRSMDTGNMNFSVFFWCSALTALPLPFRAEPLPGDPTAWAWIALVALGLITGLSFFCFAEALRRVSFPVVIIVSNSSVIFQLVWSFAFFREPITGFVVAGAAVFLAGMLLLNLPAFRSAKPAAAERTAGA